MSSSAISVVGLRSRATGVARVETVAGLLNLIPRLFVGLFTFYGRATPDARERIPPRHAHVQCHARGSTYYHATRAGARPYQLTAGGGNALQWMTEACEICGLGQNRF
jgi:hypothetical protein